MVEEESGSGGWWQNVRLRAAAAFIYGWCEAPHNPDSAAAAMCWYKMMVNVE